MSGAWCIQTLADETGTIEHRAAPRFRALWSTGLEDLGGVEGLCWSEEAAGEEDAISLHAFRWDDPAPDQAAFEALMRAAVLQIDAWIARRL
jgi:hypothetical protein